MRVHSSRKHCISVLLPYFLDYLRTMAHALRTGLLGVASRGTVRNFSGEVVVRLILHEDAPPYNRNIMLQINLSLPVWVTCHPTIKRFGTRTDALCGREELSSVTAVCFSFEWRTSRVMECIASTLQIGLLEC